MQNLDNVLTGNAIHFEPVTKTKSKAKIIKAILLTAVTTFILWRLYHAK